MDTFEQACSRCGFFKARAEFRRKATPAQRERWKKTWINTSVCDTCRKPTNSKPKLGPVGLFKKLTNAGLPAPIIEQRVAKARHVNKERRVEGLRAARAQQHEAQTKRVLEALVTEQRRAQQAKRYGARVAPLTVFMTGYLALLSATRVAIKAQAKHGKAPPKDWYDAIPKEKLIILRRSINTLKTEAQDLDPWARGYALKALPYDVIVNVLAKGE